MTIVRLAGGLGNQIFQLGTGLLLAQKSKAKKIILDDSALNSYDVKRDNELLNFFDFDKLDLKVEFRHLNITKFRLPRILPIKFNKFPLVSDRNFKSIVNTPNNIFLLLDGYFQWELSQSNFDETSKILNKIFIKKGNKIDNKKSCIVHIRGGDFVKLGWNKITPAEYYLDAMKVMIDKYEVENFIIVTDDKEYSKSLLDKIEYKYEFQCSNMIEDFYTISSYSKRILSSSTFALWASNLSNNNGTVIAPKFWFPNQKREILLLNEIK